jgi:muramoyltetrapeptide carboxypeptidase
LPVNIFYYIHQLKNSKPIKMTTPQFLSPGDKIALAAPARFVEKSELENGIKLIRSKGYEVVEGKNLFEKDNQFAGTDFQRVEDFQSFIDHPEVKAIFCVRGGYGSARIVNCLNWNNFIHNPKWIVGFSDITVFHSQLQRLGVESLHGSMIFSLSHERPDIQSFNEIFEILSGNSPIYEIPPHPLNKPGTAKGILVGGNLSVLYSLRGTPFDLDTRDKILFIEDIDEYLYHIDRIMINLKLGGIFNTLRGVIVGQMTNMKDNQIPFGKNAYEIIEEYVRNQGIPVIFGFPAGHESPNRPLILGREIIMEVSEKVSIKYNLI